MEKKYENEREEKDMEEEEAFDQSGSESEEEHESSDEPVEDESKSTSKSKELNNNSSKKMVLASAEKETSGKQKLTGKRPAQKVENPREAKRFDRKWSNDDEINLLQFMIENKSKKIEFSNLISSIDWAPDANQVRGKIKKLKGKYKRMIKKGKQSHIKDSHAILVFNLSHKLWGGLEDPTQERDYKPLHCTAVDIVLNEGFDLASKSHPLPSTSGWTRLRIQACNLQVEKCDNVRKQLSLDRKKLSLMKKQLKRTVRELEASLSEQKDED